MFQNAVIGNVAINNNMGRFVLGRHYCSDNVSATNTIRLTDNVIALFVSKFIFISLVKPFVGSI